MTAEVTTRDGRRLNKAVSDAMPGAVWHPVGGASHFVAIGSGNGICAVAAADRRAP
ncbi:hypothetical protein [Mycobacterium sp. 1164985.4]|uniref:hypothetical protein n=1 Tax=Mycobacterium sp. 1164985.4 TaxID=1834069 RepID=UPI000A510D2E|nr:hypothetical protein [Mycobacterium sp. 1164985.4]